MIPRVCTGLDFLICFVFHTLPQEPVGQIYFHFPLAFVCKLLHMSSTLLPYCFLCLPGVIIIFLCNLQVTNRIFKRITNLDFLSRRVFNIIRIWCKRKKKHVKLDENVPSHFVKASAMCFVSCSVS